ncbi:hypothetical protein QAD02_008369 [Eretmocerus hayati]|uniref:Uncharacterized protein n=1 Tax=Eretmocerus hayati TaxID=131215 RepID=A0ACC2N6C0_9HYME|nr:hypothetical protein QAD02_008369 [Eretmocerus hayati]
MRVARSGSVVVRLASDLERERVRMSGMFAGERMTVMEPRAPRPHPIVFETPNELLGEGLIEEIRGRNSPGLTPELFRDQVRVLTCVAQKETGLSNVVIGVCSEVREKMLNLGRMYVG